MNNLINIAAAALASATPLHTAIDFCDSVKGTVVSNGSGISSVIVAPDTLTIESYSAEGAFEIFISDEDVAQVGIAETAPTVAVVPGFTEWGSEAEKRFEELVDLEALGDITEADLAELDRLEQLRMEELSPRSYEQIKREKELELLTNSANSVIDDLISYAEKYYNIKAHPVGR